VNFTDKNIPPVYAEGITLGNKIKKKPKNTMTCYLYQ
jgi:hypothetical protein